MFDWAQVGTLVVALTSLVAAVSAYLKNRSDAKITGSDAILDQVQDHLLDPLTAQVNLLRADLDSVTERLSTVERKFRASLNYIRHLWRIIPLDVDIPKPPEEIEDDL